MADVYPINLKDLLQSQTHGSPGRRKWRDATMGTVEIAVAVEDLVKVVRRHRKVVLLGVGVQVGKATMSKQYNPSLYKCA